MYISTRGKEKVTASKAIIEGLAKDGGLFLPEKIDAKLDIKNIINYSYQEVAKKVFEIFLDDFTKEEIESVINQAYSKENFNEKMVGFKQIDNAMFLELYHGPTLAFKDMALTALPFLIETAKKKNNEFRKTLMLVATSGDTGGAALSSFIRNSNFSTIVLYPNGGVSEIQEKQMLYYTNDVTHAYAVDGNFDDCQTFVKKIFSEYKENKVILASANSINIGRLIPQVVYYVYSYLYMCKENQIKLGEEINVSVPTGNFGDIFAAYLAREIGVPIKMFICASNINNVLTDFFNKGIYDKNRKFIKSNSPAMDILVSSNLERLLYFIVGQNPSRVAELMAKLKESGIYTLTDKEKENTKEFEAAFTDEKETRELIKEVFDKYNYLIDPHTACGYGAFKKIKGNGLKTLIVSTASPFKFPYTVSESLNISSEGSEVEIIKRIENQTNTKVPYGITKLFDSNKEKQIKTKEEILVLVNNQNEEWRIFINT